MTSRMRSRAAASVVSALCAAVLTACATPVSYQPNEAALDGMTRDQREQMFVETLSRAAKPRIQQVWIDDASYGYDSAVAVRDGFGIPIGYTGRRRVVFFANVRELRLYDNDAVIVVDTSGRTVDKVVFGYRDDAQRMIDLIAAYRARRYAGAASPGRGTEAERRDQRRREGRPPAPRDPRYDRPPPHDPRYDRPPPRDPRYDRPPPYDPRYGPPPPYDPRYDQPPPGDDGDGWDGPPEDDGRRY